MQNVECRMKKADAKTMANGLEDWASGARTPGVHGHLPSYNGSVGHCKRLCGTKITIITIITIISLISISFLGPNRFEGENEEDGCTIQTKSNLSDS